MWWIWLGVAMAIEVDELRWRVVNDTVMGGVSTGQVEVGDDRMRFTGELSLENNGGFASVRSEPADLDLDEARALRVTVRGDGRTWSLTARRSDVPIRAGSYRTEIATASEPVTVEVPLAAFRATSMGRRVGGAPALDAAPGRIDSLGFLLGDESPGSFVLEVLAIEAVPGAEGRGAGHEAVVTTLRQALSSGVPAFNEGDHARCRDVYAAALSEVVGDDALTPGERSIAKEALARAEEQDATDAAWTLRHAIDTVLVSAPRTVPR